MSSVFKVFHLWLGSQFQSTYTLGYNTSRKISNCVLQNQTEIRGNLSEIVRNLANSDKNVNFDKDTNSNKDVNSSKDVMQIPTRLLIAITY